MDIFGPIQVFQRRIDGSVDFYLPWADYKNGFGAVSGEFWLGNENIHLLTSSGDNVLRIDMEAFDGETRFAAYTGFSIDGESTNYTLRFAKMTPASNVGKFIRIVVIGITGISKFAPVTIFNEAPRKLPLLFITIQDFVNRV